MDPSHPAPHSFLSIYLQKVQEISEDLPRTLQRSDPNLAAIAAPIFNRLATASCIPAGIINAVVIDPARRAMDPSYRRYSRACNEFSDSMKTVARGALGMVTGNVPPSTDCRLFIPDAHIYAEALQQSDEIFQKRLQEACLYADLKKVEDLLQDRPVECDRRNYWNSFSTSAYPKTYKCLDIALTGSGSPISEGEKKRRTAIALKLLKTAAGCRSPLFFDSTLVASDFFYKAIELDYHEVLTEIKKTYQDTLADIALEFDASRALKRLLDKGFQVTCNGLETALRNASYDSLNIYYAHPSHRKGDFGKALRNHLYFLSYEFNYGPVTFRTFLLSIQEIITIDPPTQKQNEQLISLLGCVFERIYQQRFRREENAYLLLDFFALNFSGDYHLWIQKTIRPKEISDPLLESKIQNAGKIARTKLIQRFEIIIESEMKARPKDYTGYDIQGACIPHFKTVHDYLVPYST